MRSSIALALPLVSLLLASRPPAATLSSSLEKDGEPLFRPFELGTYHRGVSTRSAEAQRAFDQGLRRHGRRLPGCLPSGSRRMRRSPIPSLRCTGKAQKRFGKWQELLEAPEPGPRLPVATAYRRFLRGVAYAALEKVEDAERERAAFLEALLKVPKDAKWGANAAASVLAVAVPYLDGEIAFQRGQKGQSVARLREAVRLADALLYDEPPAWQVPPRHALGAVLLADQRFAEALAVYEEDLLRYPENGWSLYGLSQALQGLKRTEEAAAALRRFQQAWSRADIQIASSCLCVEKKRADRSTPAKLESIPLPTP